jgi:small GTP-binding protein
MKKIGNDKAFKVVILGDGAIGKSTLIKMLTSKEYESQNITVGLNHEVYFSPNGLSMMIWDFGGQKQFFDLHAYNIKGARAIVYAFDLTRMISLKNIENWMSLINDTKDKKILRVLVGTKLDLFKENQGVPDDIIQEFCQDHGISYFFKSSAKKNINVHEPFEIIAQELLKNNYDSLDFAVKLDK